MLLKPFTGIPSTLADECDLKLTIRSHLSCPDERVFIPPVDRWPDLLLRPRRCRSARVHEHLARQGPLPEQRQRVHARIRDLRERAARADDARELPRRPERRERLHRDHQRRRPAVRRGKHGPGSGQSQASILCITRSRTDGAYHALRRYLLAPSVAEKENITWAGQVSLRAAGSRIARSTYVSSAPADSRRPFPSRRAAEGHRGRQDRAVRPDRKRLPNQGARARGRARLHLGRRAAAGGRARQRIHLRDDGGDENEEHGHCRPRRDRDVEWTEREEPRYRRNESGWREWGGGRARNRRDVGADCRACRGAVRVDVCSSALVSAVLVTNSFSAAGRRFRYSGHQELVDCGYGSENGVLCAVSCICYYPRRVPFVDILS